MATDATTRPLSEQDLRDLGFGAVVSRESRERLLNRDGSFNVERKGLQFWTSFSAYHATLTVPWWQFFGATTVLYLIVNARLRQPTWRVVRDRWEAKRQAWSTIRT